ncbi:LINE-1 retrotransposable element O protein [Sesamum angolense]|uniref:LINE-1 retrotransposable element O protein n=1 Tax=Sesamum angolense TaxID=2727404 RepID=A0AAE2BHL8_9LAMI|nr:LINE-1 retrotransposable element O protein [Sesamum angolense]
MWIKHHDFLNTVEQSWKHPTGAYGLINLQQKLYRLKQHLKWWNKNVFGDLFDNIKKAQEQVLISESVYDAAPCDANLTDLNRANANLTKILSMEEDFWRQKATYSAAGPDGFSALFYQVCWDIIAQDVLIADYSTISKWLCWGGGSSVIAQELIHTLDEKRMYENVVYKLDMAKAYDRVQWQFLYNVLRKMGFNEKWIQLVKNCIEQCWFSVLVNGDKAGFFSSSRGLRQGDPISPSLFIILAEYLARRLDQLFHSNPALHYYSKGGSDVNHLSFADDIIIFSNASKRSIRKIVDFLDSYQRISGQLINIGKSSFIVGNKCSSLIKQRIHNITGFVSQSLPLTYLGTPLHKGNKKRILYDDLITRMRAKLLGWKQSMLSHGGRLALIKSTLCFMPLHLIQILNPPLH